MTPSEKFYLSTKNIPEIMAVRNHFLRAKHLHKGEAAYALYMYFVETRFRRDKCTLKGCEMLVGMHYNQIAALERGLPQLDLNFEQRAANQRWYVPNRY